MGETDHMAEVLSRSVTQPLLLLSVVAGCMVVMHRNRHFSRVDMKKLVLDTYSDINDIIMKWPSSGNEKKNAAWIEERRKEWFEFINEDQTVHYNLQTLAAVCDRIITDLQDRIKDRYKLSLLKRIEEPLKRIHQFADPDGRNFPAFEQSGFILDKLYDLAGWSWGK